MNIDLNSAYNSHSIVNLAKEDQLNSVKDLIIFNDHQYHKNTNNEMKPIQSNSSIVTGLPPLSIEEILNDNTVNIVESDFEPNYDPSTSIYSMESTDTLRSTENFSSDDYLQFNFEQASSFEL